MQPAEGLASDAGWKGCCCRQVCGEERAREQKRRQGQEGDAGRCLSASDSGPPVRPAQPRRDTVTQEREKKAGSHGRWFQDQGIPEYWQESNYGDVLRIDVGHGGSPKGNWPWIFIGRTEAEAEAPVLWPPDAKSRLTGKDPDAGKDWSREEKGTTEDEMAGWHHRLAGYEFKQALGVGDGQGGLACCSPWGHREAATTERLSWTEGGSGAPLSSSGFTAAAMQLCFLKMGRGLAFSPL